MIRGPVLPNARERLWALVASRLGTVEHGLELIESALDCSHGQLGNVEGLARDAAGAPVLVLLALDGDQLLPSRVVAAIDFLERVGGALATAVPEGRFVAGERGRVLVIASDDSLATVAALRRIVAPSLQVCVLEPFRLAGEERFAVRWVLTSTTLPGGGQAAAVEFEVPVAQQPIWAVVQRLCQRLDPEVQVGGDRFGRRITWRGHLLGELSVADAGLLAAAPGEALAALTTSSEVRAFGDRLVRAYLAARAGGAPAVGAAAGEPVRGRAAAPGPRPLSRAGARHAAAAAGPLRSALAATRLSAEEYSALGGVAHEAAPPGGTFGGAAEANRAAAAESIWPPGAATD